MPNFKTLLIAATATCAKIPVAPPRSGAGHPETAAIGALRSRPFADRTRGCTRGGSRRSWFSALFAAMISSALAAAPIAKAATPAMRAYDFYSKFGVNTDINSGQTISSIITDLQYIGIYNIRDSIFSQSYAATFASLAAQGVKLHLDFQGWINPAPSMANWLSWIKSYLVVPYPGSVVGVSGPNEVDNTGAAFVYAGLTGIAAANRAQQDLYNGIKADPVLENIPVDMWPLAFTYSGNDAGNLWAVGNQTAYCDRANLHDYYAADNYSQPTYPVLGDIPVSLQRYLLNARQVCNRQSFVTTESGWYTPTQAGWGGAGVNEYVQARLLLNDLFDHAMLPYNAFVYIFTLRWGTTDFSDPGYGVMHDDGTPKISGTAIRNLMTILRDPGSNAATFTPGSLSYFLSGMPSASGNFVIQNSAGAFDIIVWNETPIWNIPTATQVSTPTSTVTVSLPRAFSGKIYNPLIGTSPIATFDYLSQVRVNLNDAPLIIELF